MYNEIKRRKKIFYQRLLILSIIFLFFSQFIFSENNNDNNFLEITYISKECFLNSKFTIELKVNEKHKNYKKIVKKPNISIKNDALSLTETKITSVYSGLLIKNTYLLTKTGEYNLKPYIDLENQKINLKKININILAPQLSKETQFKWLVLTEDNLKITKDIQQGKRYIILLAGFFHNDTNLKLNISSKTPENAILEISKIHLEKEKLNKKLKDYFKKESWNFINSFYWTPLKNSTLLLPECNIIFKTESGKYKKIIIESQKIDIKKTKKQDKTLTTEEIISNKSLELAKKKKEINNEDNKLKKIFSNFDNKKIKAKKIAKLRKKETQSFLFSDEKIKRIVIEEELGFYETIKTKSYLLQKIIILISFVLSFIIILILLDKSKKQIKKLIFFSILLFIPIIISTSIYIFFMQKNKYKTAVYIPKNKDSSFYIYHIPEETGSILSYIEIGETVIIKQETEKWICIQKKDGTSGWQKKENFEICDSE